VADLIDGHAAPEAQGVQRRLAHVDDHLLQRREGLPVTGLPGYATVEALGLDPLALFRTSASAGRSGPTAGGR
jgi:hypothetical protein